MASFDRPGGARLPVQIFLESNDSIVLTFDATISERHVSESEITDYPVEEGSDHTDHYRSRPLEFQMSGMVTESPIIVDLANNQPPNRTGQDDGTRVGSAYAFLEQARSLGDFVRVFTRFRTYSNMLIRRISAPRNARVGEAVIFDLEFRQIRFGELAFVRAPRPSNPGRNSRQNRGDKATEAVSAAAAQARVIGSDLADLFSRGIVF